MADYRIVTLDLTAAASRTEIVPRDKRIYTVTVLRMAPGTDFRLAFGEGKPEIPTVQGVTFDDLGACPIENDGLYYTCSAQPGVTVDLFIGFAPIGART